MLLKIRISKALPGRAEAYGSGKNILPHEYRRNLFNDNLSPSEEMMKTAKRFGKWKSEKERKTVSMIFSPSPDDQPTSDQLLDVVNSVMDRFFPHLQGVIFIHKNKDGTADANKKNPVMHAHFYGSILDPVSGKNLHLSQADLTEVRKWADQYAKDQYGWMPMQKTRNMNASKNFRRDMVAALHRRGSYSWKLDMISRIESQYMQASSFNDFVARLNSMDIGVLSKKGGDIPELFFSYGYKGKLMILKAASISKLLTSPEVENRFSELGGNYNGQIWRKSTSTKKSHTAQPLDKGSSGGEADRTYSGKGHVRAVDFGCLFCEHDRDICKYCGRNENGWEGSHERHGRIR